MAAEEAELDLAFRFLTEVGIISQLAGAAFEKVMPPGMTMPRFVVLHHLARLGGEWTPLRLARAMQVSKSTMTNTIGHLVRNGYVDVRSDEDDGRSKLVSLNSRGRVARDAAIATLAPELSTLVEGVSKDLLEETIPPLEKVRKFLDNRRG